MGDCLERCPGLCSIFVVFVCFLLIKDYLFMFLIVILDCIEQKKTFRIQTIYKNSIESGSFFFFFGWDFCPPSISVVICFLLRSRISDDNGNSGRTCVYLINLYTYSSTYC